MQHAKKPLLLGAHISIEGGFDKAIIRGESIGCTAMQIFTKSNRQWFAKPIEKEASDLFKNTLQQSSIQSVVAHAAYLINLGSSNADVVQKSTESLIEELQRCHLLNIPYLVLHPGSNGAHNHDMYKQIIAQLDYALERTNSSTMIALETMAGQGSNSCYQFEQLARIYEQSKHQNRLGICLDTCHIFAAGYDLRSEETYYKTWQQFDTILGINLLKVIHLNDSKKELGSRIDRHEHIAQGKLGSLSFKLLMNDPRFFDIPKILETPKDSLVQDWHNMRTLIDLLTPKTIHTVRIDFSETFRGNE
jgi:deoxyribonuclease-4